MLAVGVSGGLCAWGQNEHGQLGIGASMHGVLEDHVSPIRVPPFGGSDASPRAAYAACGPTFSIVVDSEGRVWTWGAGGSACLGHGDGTRLEESNTTARLGERTIMSTTDLMTARVLHKRSVSTSQRGSNIVASDVWSPWWAMPTKLSALEGEAQRVRGC